MRHSTWLVLALSMATLGGVATGCGGNTSGGESAAEELEQSAAPRCDTACETLLRCDLTGEGCDCSCGAGEACDCNCEEETPAGCAASCEEAVREILDDGPGCADAMLSLLTCLQGATCEGDATCRTAILRLEECQEGVDEVDDVDDEPVSGGGLSSGVRRGTDLASYP